MSSASSAVLARTDVAALARRVAGLALMLLLAACATSRPSPVTPPVIPTAPTELPWTASIGALYNLATRQACTATLVAPDVILTASHCLADGNGGTAPLRQFTFMPNEGAAPSMTPLAVTGLLQMDQQVPQGLQDEAIYVKDWVLLRIDMAPAVLRPVEVVSLRWAQLQQRLGAGDTFFSGGYGAPGTLHLTQHVDCAPVDAARSGVFLEDGLMASNCQIRPQDSGGPMVLVDSHGQPQLIALIAGFATSAKGAAFGIGPVSSRFINYLKPLPISSLPISSLPPDSAPRPAG